MNEVTAGIDVGGTKVRAVTVDRAGGVQSDRRLVSTSEPGALLVLLADLVRDLADEGARAVGVGIAGMVGHDGTVAFSPNLPGLRDVPVASRLMARSPVPVVVDNDANYAALGEARLGAGRDASQLLLVTLGTGIGGGWVVDGRVMRGADGYLGEFGHFSSVARGPRCACGAEGHWESFASGEALGQMARDLIATGLGATLLECADGEPVTAAHLSAAVVRDDPESLDLLDHYAEHVAVGVGGLCNALDPEVVVLGGGVMELGEPLIACLRARVPTHLEGYEFRPDIPVRAAELGERANAIGAALAAADLVDER